MKPTSILSTLLAIAIITIIYLLTSQPKAVEAPVKKEKEDDYKQQVMTAGPSLAQPDFRLLLHLDDPLPTLERMYNLFDGIVFNTLDLGMVNPKDSNFVKFLSTEKDSVLISGRDAFPREKIQAFINQYGAIHFSELLIKGSPLSIGSTKFSPKGCDFPPANANGKVAQMIPWIKFKDSPKQDYEKALANGFEKCGDYILNSNDDEGYVIDPGGFMLLLQKDASIGK